MENQELFDKLKRDGDFWHVPDDNIDNPDLSTPDGFFWLWERVQEREDEVFSWEDFLSWHGDSSRLFINYQLIHLSRFREALKEYLSE